MNEATQPGNCHSAGDLTEISGRIQEWLQVQTSGSELYKSWILPLLGEVLRCWGPFSLGEVRTEMIVYWSFLTKM